VKRSLSIETCVSDQSNLTAARHGQNPAWIEDIDVEKENSDTHKGPCNLAIHHVAISLCMLRLHCTCVRISTASDRASNRSIKNESGLKPQDVAQHIEVGPSSVIIFLGLARGCSQEAKDQMSFLPPSRGSGSALLGSANIQIGRLSRAHMANTSTMDIVCTKELAVDIMK
jgi:hypothetical protein